MWCLTKIGKLVAGADFGGSLQNILNGLQQKAVHDIDPVYHSVKSVLMWISSSLLGNAWRYRRDRVAGNNLSLVKDCSKVKGTCSF